MIDFFRRFFIDPIYQGTGYNVVNTVVYGLLLGFGIIFSERVVRGVGVKVDGRFLSGFLPFILLASILRSLVDANLLPRSFFLITPGIFLTILASSIISLGIGLSIQKRTGTGYHKVMAAVGMAALLYPAGVLLGNILTFTPLFYILAVFLASSLAVVTAIRKLKIMAFQGGWIFAVFLAHLLDASATFVGVEYFGFWEEHVFENFLIEKVGTALILFPFKIAVLSFVILVLQRLFKGETIAFCYFAFFVLGIAPGGRDTLTIMLIG